MTYAVTVHLTEAEADAMTCGTLEAVIRYPGEAATLQRSARQKIAESLRAMRSDSEGAAA